MRSDTGKMVRKQVVSKRFFSEIHKYCGMVVEDGVGAIVNIVFDLIA